MEVAALFYNYTLVESAKWVGVDPRAYLRAMAHAAIRGEALVLLHVYAMGILLLEAD